MECCRGEFSTVRRPTRDKVHQLAHTDQERLGDLTLFLRSDQQAIVSSIDYTPSVYTG